MKCLSDRCVPFITGITAVATFVVCLSKVNIPDIEDKPVVYTIVPIVMFLPLVEIQVSCLLAVYHFE